LDEQELLEFMRGTAYKPMTYHEMEQHYGIADAEDFRQFLKLLNQLEEAGKVVRTRNDRYGVPERMNLIRGKLQAHAKGFGFVLPEDKLLPDMYIHANDLSGAMNNDVVLARITNKGAAGGKVEGEIVRVVTRANTQVVGLFQDQGSFGFVLPDDKRMVRDIFIPKHAYMGATDGQKVVVKLVYYPEGNAAAEGKVMEVLGHKDDPGVDIISVIRKFQLPEAFPDDVTAEAEATPDAISKKELQGRRDLRTKRIVTIDGEDAKDLDDAVHVERLDNGNYLLGVHIADVSHYVQENSALDCEAYQRGCSVYLVDRVIPMLPHRLSNGICSLNPQVDRLTMSCEMEIDQDGNVVRHEIYPSVIKTLERMTYTNVRKIVQNEASESLAQYEYLRADFLLMEQLAVKLRQRRIKRGAIDFDFQEAKIIVDNLGKPIDIVKRERTIAEQIIEEFMLKANETVAEHFHLLKVPFLYRVHEEPDAEKLQHFAEFITNFGYHVKGFSGGKIQPRTLQKLLEKIKGAKEEAVISTVLLRSMKQARYDAESIGHFGLATEFYSHFTSPIRRYPDLIIHRVIREVLASEAELGGRNGGSASAEGVISAAVKDQTGKGGVIGAAVEVRIGKEDVIDAAVKDQTGKGDVIGAAGKEGSRAEGMVGDSGRSGSDNESAMVVGGKGQRSKGGAIIRRRDKKVKGLLSAKREEYLAERMVDIARQSSERERVAVEAERETDALKKAEFMLDKVGEEFEGMISSVTSFGMFVELDNTVEGLIRLSDLTDDYYNHNAAQHALIGERTSKVYRIGDEVKVRVARVTMADHTIDFEMVDMKPRAGKFGAAQRGLRASGTHGARSSDSARAGSACGGAKRASGARGAHGGASSERSGKSGERRRGAGYAGGSASSGAREGLIGGPGGSGRKGHAGGSKAGGTQVAKQFTASGTTTRAGFGNGGSDRMLDSNQNNRSEIGFHKSAKRRRKRKK